MRLLLVRYSYEFSTSRGFKRLNFWYIDHQRCFFPIFFHVVEWDVFHEVKTALDIFCIHGGMDIRTKRYLPGSSSVLVQVETCRFIERIYHIIYILIYIENL